MNPTEHDLHAFVDGQLDAARRAGIEAWLARHPERAAEVAAWQADARALRSALAKPELPENPSLDPARVRARIRGRRRARIAVAASMLLCLGLGGFAGWQLRSPPPAVAGGLPMSDALTAHRLFVSGAGSQFNPDVRATTPVELQHWLANHFERPVTLPDLGRAGFVPAAGRLLATEQGPAALVLYTDPRGNAVSFYVRPPGTRRGTLAPGARRDGDLFARYWSDGVYNFALVMPRAEAGRLGGA